MRTLAAGVLTASMALCSAACGASADALCDAECDCEGCSENDFQDCLAEADGDAREADFRGCDDFYGDLLACEDATGFCDGSDWETSCGPEKDRYKNCID